MGGEVREAGEEAAGVMVEEGGIEEAALGTEDAPPGVEDAPPVATPLVGPAVMLGGMLIPALVVVVVGITTNDVVPLAFVVYTVLAPGYSTVVEFGWPMMPHPGFGHTGCSSHRVSVCVV